MSDDDQNSELSLEKSAAGSSLEKSVALAKRGLELAQAMNQRKSASPSEPSEYQRQIQMEEFFIARLASALQTGEEPGLVRCVLQEMYELGMEVKKIYVERVMLRPAQLPAAPLWNDVNPKDWAARTTRSRRLDGRYHYWCHIS